MDAFLVPGESNAVTAFGMSWAHPQRVFKVSTARLLIKRRRRVPEYASPLRTRQDQHQTAGAVITIFTVTGCASARLPAGSYSSLKERAGVKRGFDLLLCWG
jgi:hypothetical protein